MKEKAEEKKEEVFEFELLEAHVTDKLNSTTGHEPFNWTTKVELAKRELGGYMVKEFFDKSNRKDDKTVQASITLNVEKMENYIKWFKGLNKSEENKNEK